MTAAARTVRAREANERQQQQDRRLKLRIDGLIAAIAVRARLVGRQFDETDERKRLDAGETDVRPPPSPRRRARRGDPTPPAPHRRVGRDGKPRSASALVPCRVATPSSMPATSVGSH